MRISKRDWGINNIKLGGESILIVLILHAVSYARATETSYTDTPSYKYKSPSPPPYKYESPPPPAYKHDSPPPPLPAYKNESLPPPPYKYKSLPPSPPLYESLPGYGHKPLKVVTTGSVYCDICKDGTIKKPLQGVTVGVFCQNGKSRESFYGTTNGKGIFKIELIGFDYERCGGGKVCEAKLISPSYATSCTLPTNLHGGQKGAHLHIKSKSHNEVVLLAGPFAYRSPLTYHRCSYQHPSPKYARTPFPYEYKSPSPPHYKDSSPPSHYKYGSPPPPPYIHESPPSPTYKYASPPPPPYQYKSPPPPYKNYYPNPSSYKYESP
eukprot:c9997_g1_i2 orf=349-1320(+)